MNRSLRSHSTSFYELDKILEYADACSDIGRVRIEDTVTYNHMAFPIFSFGFGSEDPEAPVLALVGGVHGLERVGTRVVLSYLRTITELIRWDDALNHILQTCRLVFYPLVNPAGMCWGSRANPNGVDLMRNAPIDAEVGSRLSIVGGHRISPKLPWYRGKRGAPMETEALILCDYIRRETSQSKCAFVVDVHSGFGMQDRFWFPYAKTRRPFAHAAHAYELMMMLDAAVPQHIYKIEPQSNSYTTHGDLWDYLYDEALAAGGERVFIPFCLEMGSWLWVKKNPRQIFSLAGAFNPIIPHRLSRTMRRHLVLFDFLLRAVYSYKNWMVLSPEKQRDLEMRALSLWYSNG